MSLSALQEYTFKSRYAQWNEPNNRRETWYETVDRFCDMFLVKYKDKNIEAIAGIESRGFLFGYPLAIRLGVPFILIRKEGKLPYKKVSYAYELEYGRATIEMHTDAISEGQRILIHDDLLATGGSAGACAALVEKCGGKVVGFNFLVSLDFLNGEDKLKPFCDNIINLVRF